MSGREVAPEPAASRGAAALRAPAALREPLRAAAMAGLGLLLFLLLLVGAGLVAGWREVAAELSRLSPALIATLLALSLVNYLLRALRWWLLAQPAGLALPLARALLYYVAGFALTATPGKLGELIRLWLMQRHHGHAFERSLGLLVLDRLSDALPMFLWVLVGAGAVAGQGPAVALLGLMVLAPGLLVLRPQPLERGLVLLARASGRFGRIALRLRRALRATAALATPRLLLAASALGLVGWAAEIVGFWLLLAAFDRPIGLAAAAFVFAFAMLVGALPLFPGGVGGTEATMIGLLLALGSGPEVAVAATGVTRLATLGFATLLGWAVLPLAIGRPARAAPGAAAVG